jgi:alcohol dehydrogenase
MARREWKFRHPTAVFYGAESGRRLGELVEAAGGPERIAVIAGTSSIRKSGALAKLNDWGVDSNALVLDIVEPEPSHAIVERLAGELNAFDPKLVISVGGGSAIDAAKAATCLGETGESSVTPYMDRIREFTARKTQLVAIPTTAGTGSEVTPFAVLTNTDTGQKKSLPSEFFYPDEAFILPEFLSSVPVKVRGDVGIDSLAHAFEALWSTNSNPVSDGLAYEAIRRIVDSFEVHYDDPSDQRAANGMAAGATLAGMAFSNTLTAGCHALSYPLCDKYGVSHGAACAMTLQAIAELNLEPVREKFEIVASLLGLDSAETVPEEIGRLKSHARTIPTFAELGIGEDDFDSIASGAFKPLLRNNPVEMTHDVTVTLLGSVE